MSRGTYGSGYPLPPPHPRLLQVTRDPFLEDVYYPVMGDVADQLGPMLRLREYQMASLDFLMTRFVVVALYKQWPARDPQHLLNSPYAEMVDQL